MNDDPEPPPPTGQAPTADMREEFARMSARSAEEPGAERAFVQGKIDMIWRDPTLSGPEKAAAIRELEQRLADGGTDSADAAPLG